MGLKDTVLNVVENAVAAQVQAKFDPALDAALVKLEEKLSDPKYAIPVAIVKQIVSETRDDAKAKLLELVDKIDGEVG